MKGKYVYLMENKLGYLKIGIAQDVDKRRNQVRLSSGQDVKVLYKQFAPDAKVVEDALHRFFRASRKEGEFFQGIGKDFAISKIQSFISLQEETIAMAEYKGYMSKLGSRDAFEFDTMSPGCRNIGCFMYCDISKTVSYGAYAIVDPFAIQSFTSKEYNEVRLKALKDIQREINVLVDAKQKLLDADTFDAYTTSVP